MRTFCIISTIILTCFLSYASDSTSLIDTVYVKVNGKEYLDTPSRIYYKDSLIIFKNDSIVVLMQTKTRLQLLIHDSLISGQVETKVQNERITTVFKQGYDTFIKVGINKDLRENKQIGWVIPLLAGLFLGLGVFRFLSGSSRRRDQDSKPVRSDGNKIVERLSELGYFKYLNDTTKKSELKELLTDTINNNNILVTIDSEDNLEPIDKRLFFCDGEALFEIGGIEEYLTLIKPSFNSRNLTLEWGNEITDEIENYWSHKITVNDKEYVAFEGDMSNMFVWGIAQLNFFEMINDVLKRQNSDEQVYPISGGEDGQFILLNKEQFDYLESIDLDDEYKPRTVSDWKEYNELK